MKKLLITFSGSRYKETTHFIVNNAPQLGADEVKVYDDSWLIEKRPEFIEARKDLFYEPCDVCAETPVGIPPAAGTCQAQIDAQNRRVENCPRCSKIINTGNEKYGMKFTRGFGWFCWKPFIILDALERFCEDGDIVFYTDADCYPYADLTPFYDYANEHGAMLFSGVGFKHRHWSKRDCQIGMDMDSDFWRDKQAGNARFMLFKKGAIVGGKHRISTETFLRQWLQYASNKKLTTFEKSENEYPDLQQHRCEQSILTNFAHWYNIPLHRACDDSGNVCIK